MKVPDPLVGFNRVGGKIEFTKFCACCKTVVYCKPDGKCRKVLVSPEIAISLGQFYRRTPFRAFFVLSILMRRTASIYAKVASDQTTQVLVYFKGDFRRTFHFRLHLPRSPSMS